MFSVMYYGNFHGKFIQTTTKTSKTIKITSKRVRHFSELLMIFIDVIFERILLPYGYLSFVLALWVCVCVCARANPSKNFDLMKAILEICSIYRMALNGNITSHSLTEIYMQYVHKTIYNQFNNMPG